MLLPQFVDPDIFSFLPSPTLSPLSPVLALPDTSVQLVKCHITDPEIPTGQSIWERNDGEEGEVIFVLSIQRYSGWSKIWFIEDSEPLLEDNQRSYFKYNLPNWLQHLKQPEKGVEGFQKGLTSVLQLKGSNTKDRESVCKIQILKTFVNKYICFNSLLWHFEIINKLGNSN